MTVHATSAIVTSLRAYSSPSHPLSERQANIGDFDDVSRRRLVHLKGHGVRSLAQRILRSRTDRRVIFARLKMIRHPCSMPDRLFRVRYASRSQG